MPFGRLNQPPALSIQARLEKVRQRIHQACERSGRPEDSVRLVAVTKNVAPNLIQQALNLGITEIGENRIQEALSKKSILRWAEGKKGFFHLVGSLQTNKARKAVENFDVIQSVDRPKLAIFLDRVAGEVGKKQACYVEVKISPEESKKGVPLTEAADFIQSFGQYSHLKLEGLMTIAPFDQPVEETRMFFKNFVRFFESQKKNLGETPVLSMGMTDDFEIAIEEGATMVRVGRAIFGERDK